MSEVPALDASTPVVAASLTVEELDRRFLELLGLVLKVGAAAGSAEDIARDLAKTPADLEYAKKLGRFKLRYPDQHPNFKWDRPGLYQPVAKVVPQQVETVLTRLFGDGDSIDLAPSLTLHRFKLPWRSSPFFYGLTFREDVRETPHPMAPCR